MGLMDSLSHFNPLKQICQICGLTYGAHRGTNNQCPQHEGWMDWPTENVTFFKDSGEEKEIPCGTQSKLFY